MTTPLSQPTATLTIPDASPNASAIQRTTHLGIGAHQDDLEFMALHGILECFQSNEKWFSGITCTNGSGSARTAEYKNYSDKQMMAQRAQEQITAAHIGQYSYIAQLAHPSKAAKEAQSRTDLRNDLVSLITQSSPEIIYTHNPFDKHTTHIGIFHAVIEAIHEIPTEQRPKQLIGCEVWRGLDWLPDSLKLIHDVSKHPNLAASLNGVFDSQIVGGKRYDRAVEGRRRSNATFHDSHTTDNTTQVQYAIDLTPLIDHHLESIQSFTTRHLQAFQNEIIQDNKRVNPLLLL